MSIQQGELKLYKSQVVNDLATNGGRRSNNEVVTGELENGFPVALPEDMAAGGNTIRKFAYTVANDDDLPLYSAKLFLDAPTPGDDWVTMWLGDHRDTVADHPSPDRVGVFFLAANVNAGDQSIIVNCEDAELTSLLAAGCKIGITDKVVWSAAAGNREWHEIDSITDVAGSQVTLAMVGTLANSYLVAANARIMMYVDVGHVQCSVDNWVDANGLYDEENSPVVCDNIGTIEQTWTLTWGAGTSTFTVVGDSVGSVGSGTPGSDFVPINPVNSKPYFTLPAAGHTGTPGENDTFVFQTHPADVPFYMDREIPAGASPQAGNRITPVLLGATA